MKGSARPIIINEDTKEEYSFESEREVVFSLRDDKLVMEDKVSRKSLASLRFSNGKVYLRDLGSDDGTYYKSLNEKEWSKIGEKGSEFIDDKEKRRELNKGIAVFDASKPFEMMLEKKEVLKFTPRR